MMDPKKNHIAFFYPETTKNWKKLNLPKVKDTDMLHDAYFVRPHRGKDAGTDFFDDWTSSTSRIYDLFQSSKDWKPRKHKRKVIKPEHTTDDNYKYCGCGDWYFVCLPPFEMKEMFVRYENLFSLILLFNKHRK